jgi:predicted PurR-regulated permease PerM
VAGDVAGIISYFSDIVLLFFLAWLLSFALLPVINGVARVVPRAPRYLSVIVVYLAIVGVLLAVVIQVSSSLATSIGQIITDAPELQVALTEIASELERRLAQLGFEVDLVSQVPQVIANLEKWALELVGPLQSLAFASLGVIGNILILVILSIYIAIDRSAITAFLFRLVPPVLASEARLLNTSVSKSFGGFLRGQLIMGALFAVFTGIINVLFGLPYAAVTTVAAGLLHAIPFFGPFISWMPPVGVALLLQPDAVIPVLILMGIAWFVTMNVVAPRLMAGAVGIHPIVVLASVVIGSKVAGIAGAIFGIPIAAVASAFFFHWFGRSRENGSVADRAAQRLAAREGHPVRRPREPVPGVDADVTEAGG